MKRPADGITLAAAGVAAAVSVVLSWLMLWLWRSTGHEYPQLPWLGLVPMGLYVVLVLVAAWRIRQYVRRAGSPAPVSFVPSPQQARATLVACQAGALGGALLLGFYLASAAAHLSALDVPSVRILFVRALVSGLGALCVSAAGFVGQWMCRLPEDEDEDRRSPGQDGIAYG